MQNLNKWGAWLGAGAVLFTLAGCADRNKNGQPDSPATAGEVSNAVENAGDAAATAVPKAGATASSAIGKAGDVIEDAGATAATTSAVKNAYAGQAGLKGSTINVDTKAEDKTVILRGSVTSQAQKKLAESIAKQKATGYKIVNQLAVKAK
jgi:osmotically-inducible protein OsmY